MGFYTVGICAKCHRTKIIFILKKRLSEVERRIRLVKKGWNVLAGRDFCPRCSSQMRDRAATEAVIKKLQAVLDSSKIVKARGKR